MAMNMAMKNKKSYCRNGFYNFSQGFNSPRLHQLECLQFFRQSFSDSQKL